MANRKRFEIGSTGLIMSHAKQYWLISILIIFLWTFGGSGCSRPSADHEEDYLIRVGDQKMTRMEFTKALEFSSTAYPHNTIQNREVLRTIRMRLMNQLIEEMLLMQKAGDLNIVVTEAEVQAAVNEIKEDYPDNQFKEAFLENAISYETWKKRLKIRILMEKVIRSELEDKIEITKEDISRYYKENYGDEKLEAEIISETPDVNEMIIKSIRRQKAEDSYKTWIKNVRNEYKIEINKELWEKVLKS